MEYQPEIKKCQNCKNDFIIEPEDFSFYEKIKVPPPTWCPECRLMRRMSFMNIFSLYKRKCDLCKVSIISMISDKKPHTVYCSGCWWGDSWDGTEHAMDYNPSRNFLEQLQELMLKTPFMALDVQGTTLVNSQYVNYASNLKNCYLLYFADYSENSAYCSFLTDIKECLDCYRIRESELCYESVGIYKCFRAFFSEECDSSVDVLFSKNCSGCTNVFGCMNLKNKSYCIFNKQYSKEDYQAFIKNNPLNQSNIEKFKKESRDFWLTQPVRNTYGNSLNINVSGEYTYESKNTKESYMCTSAENCAYVQMMSVPTIKDSYDVTGWGDHSELEYEGVSVGMHGYNTKFSLGAYPNAFNNEYCYYTSSCNNVFGCANLKKKDFCILNKQYSKEEYTKIVEDIKNNMNENPYIDSKGKVFKYGEFFPSNFSLYGYNETIASDFFPKTKSELESDGLEFFEKEENTYKSTMPSNQLNDDSINNINIKNEVIECSCGKCYRFVDVELLILKKMNVGLHNKCPECRRLARFGRINKPKLYVRDCAKCNTSMKTSYAPDRPEIVYCEKCYQQEVY